MSTESVGVVVLGTGTIGRALLGQLAVHRAALSKSLGINLDVLAVASSRLWTRPERGPVNDQELATISTHGIASVEHAPYTEPVLRKYLATIDRRLIIVDITASESIGDLLLVALATGHDLVMANKKPLSGNPSMFAALTRYRTEGHAVRYETTVGAALPVIRTLQDMVDTGDKILAIDAALSGTLGYICTALEDGVPFSAAVRAAHRAGYTEPDPRDDLAGLDVARKAVILARTSGFQVTLEEMPLAGLGKLGPSSATAEEFLASLEEQDAAIAEQVATAGDHVLRYVARVTQQGTTTGLQAVPRSHPLAALRGSANMVAITSARYPDVPLVISGPGAGPDVTAGGLFADVLAAAQSRSGK